MRIEDFRLDTGAAEQLASASVVWESVERAPMRIEFAIPNSSEVTLTKVPEAFLIACAVPALSAGEARIACDAELSPLLLRSLPGALALLQGWNPSALGACSPPRIMAPMRRTPPIPANRRGVFFSGGVDSMDLLLAQPPMPEHAAAALGIVVQGFDIAGKQNSACESSAFDELYARATPLLAARGLAALPVRTNLRHLDDRSGFWGDCFAGFALASVAHALSGTINCAEVAASGEPLNAAAQSPDGVHPTLIYSLGSESLAIWSPRVEVSRMHRLQCIAAEPAALAALRVCFGAESDAYNCGKCEKCTRTALGLMLLGADPKTCFPHPISPGSLRKHNINHEAVAAMYREMLPWMTRPEWAAFKHEVEQMLARWARYSRWRAGHTVAGRVRQLWRSISAHHQRGPA